jgi:hypothetical protein
VIVARRLDGDDSVLRIPTQPKMDDYVAIVKRQLMNGWLQLTTEREEQFVRIQNT